MSVTQIYLVLSHENCILLNCVICFIFPFLVYFLVVPEMSDQGVEHRLMEAVYLLYQGYEGQTSIVQVDTSADHRPISIHLITHSSWMRGMESVLNYDWVIRLKSSFKWCVVILKCAIICNLICPVVFKFLKTRHV